MAVPRVWKSASGLFRSIVVGAIRAYLGFALRTTRWTFKIDPQSYLYLTSQEGRTAVVAFWHEVLPLTPALWWWAERQNPAVHLRVLVSRNSDGRVIADVVAPWRIWSIAGSSNTRGKSKGGAAAMLRMRASLLHGCLVAITPDGPCGPRRQTQQGAEALARLVGKPVIPMGASCRAIRLKSWDKMFFPLPFGRGVFVSGAPLWPTPDCQMQDPAFNLQTHMNNLMEQARVEQQHAAAGHIALRPQVTCPSHIWKGVGALLAPALPLYLRWRQSKGKEVAGRVREKMGFATCPRPSGKLLWFHAASVGEALSILPLVQACLRQNAHITVLVTTGTVTASTIVAQRFAHDRVVHQFMPLDVPRWCQRFLNHWAPQAAVFTESELWPTVLGACHARNLPVVLVNGRMSASSFRFWQRVPGVAQRMLAPFAWVSARTEEDAQRLRSLGALSQLSPGDLKTAAPPLPVDAQVLADLRAVIGERPVFVAASTHAGEEEVIARAAHIIRQTYPNLLSIIVPRHPERGADISSRLNSAPRRAQNALPTERDAFWVCDTLGELGLFFRLGDCTFIGNSLPVCPGGGHNPFEPARLGCVVATGPRVHNFEEAYQALHECVQDVQDEQSLAAWVVRMLSCPDARAVLAQQAQAVATVNATLPDDLAHQILELIW
ncbi:glycosyltransferase N-terminal domain-containing protein [Acetobacter sp. DsW_54]|uniref:glycosyltransferase N-terminal domain-containing protein n=1 Tax=Acetobacter sp. DsW_54 TaxID=1670660 RepID=UPI000A3857DC|nr:glycosyltransferase N-terminal domain-containing protein [Acetobacter sp. DsW_54]OUI99715.1 3-deoxy-D-manno-octulosonic acid transferase [Acetobacter sp. DsW_54]